MLPTLSLAESPNGSSDFTQSGSLTYLFSPWLVFWGFFFGVTPTVVWLTGIRELPRFSFLFLTLSCRRLVSIQTCLGTEKEFRQTGERAGGRAGGGQNVKGAA